MPLAARFTAVALRECEIEGCLKCSSDPNQCQTCFNEGSSVMEHGNEFSSLDDPFIFSSTGFSVLGSDGLCVRDCGSEEFLDSEYTCKPVSSCRSNEYEYSAPTRTSDRDCRTTTICDSSKEFMLLDPTATSDRECHSFLRCDQESVRDPENPEICIQCPQGKYYNASGLDDPEDFSACIPLAVNEYVVRRDEDSIATNVLSCDCEAECIHVKSDTRNDLLCEPSGCPSGYIKKDYYTDDSECTDCGPGHEIPKDDNRYFGSCSMYRCHKHTYDHDNNPHTDCKVCPIGHEITAERTCEPCQGASTDDDYDASTPCLQCPRSVVAHIGPCEEVMCPENTVLFAGVCLPDCPPGQELVDGACQACSMNTFSLGRGQLECLPFSECTQTQIERHSPTSSTDRICQECEVNDDRETCAARAETAQSESTTEGSGTDMLPIGVGVGIGLLFLSILVALIVARVRTGSNKTIDPKVNSGHSFDNDLSMSISVASRSAASAQEPEYHEPRVQDTVC